MEVPLCDTFSPSKASPGSLCSSPGTFPCSFHFIPVYSTTNKKMKGSPCAGAAPLCRGSNDPLPGGDTSAPGPILAAQTPIKPNPDCSIHGKKTEKHLHNSRCTEEALQGTGNVPPAPPRAPHLSPGMGLPSKFHTEDQGWISPPGTPHHPCDTLPLSLAHTGNQKYS